MPRLDDTRFKNRRKLPWWGASFEEISCLTSVLYVRVVAWTFPTYVAGTFCGGIQPQNVPATYVGNIQATTRTYKTEVRRDIS